MNRANALEPSAENQLDQREQAVKQVVDMRAESQVLLFGFRVPDVKLVPNTSQCPKLQLQFLTKLGRARTGNFVEENSHLLGFLRPTTKRL